MRIVAIAAVLFLMALSAAKAQDVNTADIYWYSWRVWATIK
jgi:hypothetical protein